jgi:hypothetical protein
MIGELKTSVSDTHAIASSMDEHETDSYAVFDTRQIAAHWNEQDPHSIYELLRPGSEADEGLVIRAAGRSDPRQLQKLLEMAQRLPVEQRKKRVLDFVWPEEASGV